MAQYLSHCGELGIYSMLQYNMQICNACRSHNSIWSQMLPGQNTKIDDQVLQKKKTISDPVQYNGKHING